MAKLSSYTKDTSITEKDKLAGSSYIGIVNGVPKYQTASYTIEDLGTYFGETVGISDKTYRHIQGLPSNTWVITHNLNKYPSVTVQDSAGSIVLGEITYNSLNTITLTFSGSFSGQAHFN